MNPQPTPEFEWLSPLGVSSVLFLLYGGLYVLIGVLMPLLHNREVFGVILIISARTDTIVFGQAPQELLKTDPSLAQFRTILYFMLAGLMLLAGSFQIAITWFGLRQGQVWALAALTIGGLAVLPYWYMALRPYFQPGVNLTLGDTPPFMWVPAALLLPAVVLGWIGLG